MWRRTVLLGALALSVICPPSRATELREPVSVERVGAFPVAERGRALRATFQVRAHEAAIVTDLAVGGRGWSARVVDRRTETFAVVPGGFTRFAIEATPADENERLVVTWKVNGQTYRRAYDFSPATARLRREGGRCVAAPPGSMPPRGRTFDTSGAPEPVGLKFSGPIGTVEPEISREAPAQPAGPQGVRWIRVTGWFGYQYQRDPWPWLGADYITVSVFDQDFGGSGTDIELGRGMTDSNGWFDITIPWVEMPSDAQPDLYAMFVAGNGSMHIQRENGGIPYWWRTGTTWDFTGSTLDMGGQLPDSEGDFPRVHIVSNMQRFSRWYASRMGIALPYITIEFPSDNSVSYHNVDREVIGIVADAAWSDLTHGHEYGHHFVHAHLPYYPPDYCNGICDDDGCGHCIWCSEANGPFTPWSEALPYWVSMVQCSDFLADYGWEPSLSRDFEDIIPCGEDLFPGLAPDARYVEGMIAALLRDLYDSEDEEEDDAFAGGKDTLALGWQPVMNAIFALPATTLQTFAASFIATYPELLERFWRTAANNRYDFDQAPPAAPANFHSTSHTAGVASGDATPTFQWTRAVDDASGPVGYSIHFGATAQLPDTVVECGDVTTWTSPIRSPGSYQVTIRTLDRSGRWSTGYSTWGTLVLREPTPSNLTPNAYIGWDYPLVPSDRSDFTFLTVETPTAPLPGNTAATYWNTSTKNVGEASTGINWLLRAWVDGVPGPSVACTPLGAGSTRVTLNQGPITVRGGRHTLAMHDDDDEEIAETVETDNEWAKQWIWTPYALASGAGVTRVAPPDRIGGWEDLPSTAGAYYNCDGLRVTNGAGGNWRALWLRVGDPLVDYDVRLHDVATAADAGFASNRAYSQRPEGCLDAVLYNNLKTPTVAQWDVGILNASGGDVDYYAKLVTASPIDDGDSMSISYPSGEMLRLRQFDLAVADTGWYSLKVRLGTGSGPVYVAWYDDDLGTVALTTETALDTVTGPRGPARLDLHLGEAGVYGLAMYRDPKDGTAAMSIVLEFERMKPDYTPKQLAGWHSPLVPRPAADGTSASVPAPDTLHGDAASTYFNLAVGNSAYGDQAANVYNQVWVDGVSRWGYSLLPPNPLDETTYNSAVGRSISGGRHSIGLHVDPNEALTEVEEDNNLFGEQWVFGPATLGTVLTRTAPPEMTGGWDDVTYAPYGVYYNCDGLRVGGWSASGHDMYWGGFAVMPGDTSDLDVRLHELSPGARTGFRSNLVRSTNGPGLMDYVLVNYNRTAFRPFDLGVLSVDGAQGYTAQSVKSVYRGVQPDGTFGPYTMAAGYMMHLHEFFLDTDVYDVTLVNTSGNVNWGISAHSGAEAYHNLSTAMPGGMAWTNGPGQNEFMRFRKDAPNYVAIAVWKAGSGDLGLAGSYTLEVGPSPVGVPGGEVTRTALAGAWPNPFQSGATVAFELAAEGEVSLEVYDLHGARVRTLASGRWPAGRHEVRWDGRGELPAAPGIYFVRFRAGGVAGTRRLVKLD